MQISENSENKVTTAEVGEGIIDWAPVKDVCEEIGVRWYAVDWCHKDEFECLRISFENKKKFV